MRTINSGFSTPQMRQTHCKTFLRKIIPATPTHSERRLIDISESSATFSLIKSIMDYPFRGWESKTLDLKSSYGLCKRSCLCEQSSKSWAIEYQYPWSDGRDIDINLPKIPWKLPLQNWAREKSRGGLLNDVVFHVQRFNLYSEKKMSFPSEHLFSLALLSQAKNG